MKKKDIYYYTIILILVVVLMWQWMGRGVLNAQIGERNKANEDFSKYLNQLQILSGIGILGSTHQHADVKVYINGKPIDFSQRKYQLTSSFLHFEEGIGDVIHTHATGLTLGHMMKSVNIDFSGQCLVYEETGYCNDNENTLKFFVNGQQNNEFDNYMIKDKDKYLVSYGSESEEELQAQLDSVTDLAGRYSR